MRIKRCCDDDEPALRAIYAAAARLGQPFAPDQDPVFAGEVWAAEDAGALAGFIRLQDGFVRGLVAGLFVAPDRHRQGIGRRLLDHAAALKGGLTAEVYAANPLAPPFYRRCGFVEVGRRDGQDGHAVLILRRPV